MTVTKYTAGTGNDFIAQLQEESKQWEREDRGVLSAMKKLGGHPLPGDDALIVASHIHAEFPRLKVSLKAQNRTLGEFCKAAGLSTGDYY